MNPADDARVVAAIIRLAVGIRWRMATGAPEPIVRWTMAEPVPASLDAVGLDRAARYVRWITRLVPTPSGGPCVPRSLILHRFALHLGQPSRLHWGVRRESGRVEGHMWMTLDGAPFREHPDVIASYTQLHVWPPESEARP